MHLSDVGLAPYASTARAMSLPNKPFEYFSGGLPVASSIQGELKDVLEKNDCGRTYDADSPDELSAILREWHSHPELCHRTGQRGRQLLEKEFSMESIHSQMERHFLNAVECRNS
jgi:glycosyltransferase involved in cell wall biosynthesis